MTEFYLDAEFLPESDRVKLQSALSDLATSDAPLLLEIITVNEEEIRELNARERGIDRVTDVLSFPSMDGIKGEEILSDEHGEELDEEGRLFLGSIAICEQRAKEQAEEYGHSYARELNYLIVHGVLHCLGYDHETEEEKREMRKKEETVMEKLSLTRE
ncbi:MAG: rRNA maturation RNase YbeY [Clostridiales bacterium]|nr:rRNA maturation RNase YbeY [Clostridiales bacterium]